MNGLVPLILKKLQATFIQIQEACACVRSMLQAKVPVLLMGLIVVMGVASRDAHAAKTLYNKFLNSFKKNKPVSPETPATSAASGSSANKALEQQKAEETKKPAIENAQANETKSQTAQTAANAKKEITSPASFWKAPPVRPPAQKKVEPVLTPQPLPFNRDNPTAYIIGTTKAADKAKRQPAPPSRPKTLTTPTDPVQISRAESIAASNKSKTTSDAREEIVPAPAWETYTKKKVVEPRRKVIEVEAKPSMPLWVQNMVLQREQFTAQQKELRDRFTAQKKELVEYGTIRAELESKKKETLKMYENELSLIKNNALNALEKKIQESISKEKIKQKELDGIPNSQHLDDYKTKTQDDLAKLTTEIKNRTEEKELFTKKSLEDIANLLIKPNRSYYSNRILSSKSNSALIENLRPLETYNRKLQEAENIVAKNIQELNERLNDFALLIRNNTSIDLKQRNDLRNAIRQKRNELLIEKEMQETKN